MLGLVYKDTGIDKICTNVSGTYSADLPANLHIAADVINLQTLGGIYIFKTPFYTSRAYNLFRLVTINVTPDDNYTFSETKVTINDKVVYVSNDNLNIVAYRSGSYQVVTVASLLTVEIPIVGDLSFSDMQLLMTAAATLTSPQIRYIRVIPNDAISFSEL